MRTAALMRLLLFSSVGLAVACFPDPPRVDADDDSAGSDLSDRIDDVSGGSEIAPDQFDGPLDADGEDGLNDPHDVVGTAEAFIEVDDGDATPGDALIDDTGDVDVVDVADSVATDQDVDAPACGADLDCAHLDAVCQRGACSSEGQCVAMSRDEACDDGDPCTQGDWCSGAACSGQAYECDDHLSCTDDLCDGAGGCIAVFQPGTCLIGGVCRVAGEVNPDNQCEHCLEGTTWSPLVAPCEDGLVCTVGDQCEAGNCVGGSRRTDDGYDWIEVLRGRAFAAANRLWSDPLGILVGSVGRYVGSAHALVPQGTRALWSVHPAARIIGVSAAGGVWLSTACEPAPQVNLTTLSVPLDPQTWNDCVFEVDRLGVASEVVRLPHEAHARLTNGELYGSSPLSVYAGQQQSIVKMDASGQILWSVSHDGALLAMVASADDSLVALVRADGDLTVSAVDGTSSTRGPGINVMMRLRTDGSLSWKTILYQSNDIDFRLDEAVVAVHPSGDLSVAGSMYVRTATFPHPTGPISYQASGFYGVDPPQIGAGGDGYLARLTPSGELRWVRFLTPLHDFGSSFTAIAPDVEDVLVAGRYDERALLDDGNEGLVFSDTFGVAFPDQPRSGSVIARYDRIGELAWARGHHGTFTGVARSAHDPTILATLHSCEGPLGFPPATLTASTTCREAILSFNANLGFECSTGAAE